MTRWLRRLALSLLAFSALALLVWSFLPEPVHVDTGAVERGPMIATVDHEGKTRVRERYIVSAPLGGRLTRIALHPGDRVSARRTLLASIEPSEPTLLDARAVAQAEARVKAAEAAKDRSEPNLRRNKSTNEHAIANYNRIRKLYERGSTPRQDLDDAEHELRISAEEVRAAEFASKVVDFELELTRAALVRTRPTTDGAPDPGRFEIQAPIDGRILRVFQESEAVVAPGARLVEIGDPTDLEIEVDVLSTDAVKVTPGARVILDHWGGPVPLNGRVRLVEPSAFTKVSALGVEEQRVNVVIDLVDPPARRPTLGDAFRVEARIVVWESHDTLKIPSGALFRRGDGWAVFIADHGQARLRNVNIGPDNGLETQVLNGLNQGEQVILHPSDRIQDGGAIEASGPPR